MLRSIAFKRSGVYTASAPVFNKPFIGINNIRFNSTVPSSTSTEITSQLPSFASDVAQNASQLTSDTIGYLESVGLPGNWFMGIFEHSLEYIHVYTGMPWWVSIIIATLAFRLSLFPLSIKMTENMARNAKAKPELDAVKAKINDPSNTMREKQLLQQQMFAVMKKHGIKHRYLLAPVFQMATSIGLFISIREMCLFPVDGFTTQGAYWFQDLTATDPYAALPIVSALIYLGSIRRGGENGEFSMPSAFRKFMVFMPIASIPFTMQLSAGVGLYLTTSAVFSACQMFLFSNKSARKMLGLSQMVKPPVDKNAKPDQGIKDSITGFAERMRENSEAKAKQYEQVNDAHKLAKIARQAPSKAVIKQRRRKN